MMAQNSLSIFTKAAQMLAEADTILKAKDLKDLALTAADWAKRKGLGEEAVQYARSYALEAERKMGEMLRIAEKAKASGSNQYAKKERYPLGTAPPTLTELGLSKRESTEARMLADLPDQDFEKLKAGIKTKVQVIRERKEERREVEREQNRVLVQQAPTIITAAGSTRYQTIVLDPPWDWGDENDSDQLGRARPTYATMPITEIAELPVAKLAATNAHIYLWITNRSLPKVFALLEEWKFRFITAITWIKPSFGMGNYFRGSTEHILFGVKGSLPLLRNDVGTHFLAKRFGQHSSKPEEFYSIVETCSPGPWLEMFSRQPRKGWVAWGAEAQTS